VSLLYHHAREQGHARGSETAGDLWATGYNAGRVPPCSRRGLRLGAVVDPGARRRLHVAQHRHRRDQRQAAQACPYARQSWTTLVSTQHRAAGRSFLATPAGVALCLFLAIAATVGALPTNPFGAGGAMSAATEPAGRRDRAYVPATVCDPCVARPRGGRSARPPVVA
jgi:hypothetical protein